MKPQVFGWEHLTYLGVFVVITVLSLFFFRKFLKTKTQQTVCIKIIAGLLLGTVMLCRVAISINTKNWIYLLPNTICGLTSAVFSILVLCGKPNNNLYHGIWYLGLVGGIVTLAYPDFISQDYSFFYLATITSFLHHSFSILLCAAMVLFGWFKPEFKKSYYFPIIFCGYLVIGLFEMTVLNVSYAMNITKPLLEDTPLNFWFILVSGTIGVVIFTLICESVRIRRSKQNKK